MKKEKNLIEFVKSIDTITTKLLTLVLFITIIPLMVVANFSTGIINNIVFDNSKKDLEFSVKLLKEKYQDELNYLKFFVVNSSRQLDISDKKKLNNELKEIKKSLNLDVCIVIDKKNKIIASGENLENQYVLNDLAKISKLVFSGQTIISTEVLSNKDFNLKQNKQVYKGLSQIIATPVYGKENMVVFLVGRSIRQNSNILNLINKLTGSSVSIFQVTDNNKINLVLTNLNSQMSNFVEQQLSEKILYKIIKANSEHQVNNIEIGWYEPVRNYLGNITGIVYVGIPSIKFTEPGNKNIKNISIVSVISLIVAIIIAALFARTITNPILKLASVAKYIAVGDLKHRVKITGNDEIAQLATIFNQMAMNLYKQEQLRDNFVATLTHDLKVPMLAENQTVNYLLKEAYGPITQEQQEVLELIKSTNNSSLEMVSTLLEVYRYDTGNVQLLKTDVNIVDLVKTSVEQIKSLAEDKKITISINCTEEKLFIKCDEREIKRVLHNLISNAISNGIKRGTITCSINFYGKKVYNKNNCIDCYSTLKEPVTIVNSVCISIKDDGIGITREEMNQLFQRFSLNKGRKPAGTGLGLYYSHQVITQHKGKIWVESNEGKGSDFKFILPVDI